MSGAFVVGPEVLDPGAPSGPLAGSRLAVKDVFDLAGTVTGAGNPTFAEGRPPATAHAAAVRALVEAGAAVVGKTVTDELAYSLGGTNVHHGTPPNPAAPGRAPGGSSSGSASAVAAGDADLGLGTDTGGSIRIPASYCGLVGWRPTHGAVDATGLVDLARSFDTVGLLTRDVGLLVRAAEVLLPAGDPVPSVTEVLLVEELLAAVPTAVADAVRAAAADAGATGTIALGIDPEEAATAFRTLQGREAWAEHGAWIEVAGPTFGPDIAERFALASRVTAAQAEAAQVVRDEVRRRVVAATADGRVLLAPAAAGAAPLLDATPDAAADTRARTLRLTAPAGLAGAPVVVLPLAAVAEGDDELPLGVAVIGAPGTDRALLAWAAGL